MFNTKVSSTIVNNRTKKNFVEENSKVKISKYVARKHFTSGFYTQHHPSQCYHLLNAQPIHLKKESAIDGKQLVRIKYQENVRDLLVPATANVYPAIWPVGEIKRIEAKSQSITLDEKKMELQRKYDERKQLEDECERRKAHLKEIDKSKLDEHSDDNTDSETQNKQILEQAMIAQLEAAEEFKRVNFLISAKKCQHTRAFQVAEKNDIKRELRDYEYFMEKTILDECDKALLLESENALKRRKSKAKLAEERKALVNQKELAEKMAAEKALEMDKAEALATAVENANLEEQEKKQRIEQMFKTREDIENFKALRERLKNKALEEERITEMKALEYMRKKQENIKKLAEEKRLIKEEKQRKADELLMLQAKLLETRNQQGESNIKRSQEEKEREFRRKEKEAAIKRKMTSKEVQDVRAFQLKEIRRKREMELEQERLARQQLIEKVKDEEMKEKEKQEKFRLQREKLQNDIINQIKQKEIEKLKGREQAQIEYVRDVEKEKERIANIESVIHTKLMEMQEAKIPIEDIQDIQRKIQSKLIS